jgi:2-hydroxymuconate-semialdehyde hydrolase
MRQGQIVSSVLLAVVLSLAGCGSSAPSLTKEELSQKYPEKRYVQIDDVSLHYEQEGLGRPLILLHGLPTSTYLWRDIVPGLTFGNTVYNLDLMGFGLSEKPQNVTYSIDTYVDQLSKFIEAFHLEHSILVGHDIGAPIVALYTLRNPDKVRKLILMDGPLYSRTPPLGLRLLRTRLIGELFTGDWFLKRMLRGGVANQDVMNNGLLDAYLKPYHDDPGARTALLKCAREFNLRPALENEVVPNLSKIAIPTLLVWGDGDPYAPLDFGKKLDEVIPNSQLVVILRTSHYAIEERPEEVRAVLKEFIDQ